MSERKNWAENQTSLIYMYVEYVEKIMLRFHESPDTFPSFTGPLAGYFYLVLSATAS